MRHRAGRCTGSPRARSDGLPFASDSLTEDYELGLAIAAAGGRCRFVRVRGDDGRLIATRAFFPDRFDTVVRQKCRWVLGIALQGWDRVGWSGGLIEYWMRIRDRRGPLTALVLLAGYALVLLTGLMGVAVATGLTQPVPLTPLLKGLLIVNALAFVWRVAMRFAFTAREYGVCRRAAGGGAVAAGQCHRDHRRAARGVRLCRHAGRARGGVGQDRA